MLSSHVLLYLPLIKTTLIFNESLVYEWQVQQHIRLEPKVYLFDIMWVNVITPFFIIIIFCEACLLSCFVFAVRPFAEMSLVGTWNILLKRTHGQFAPLSCCFILRLWLTPDIVCRVRVMSYRTALGFALFGLC